MKHHKKAKYNLLGLKLSPRKLDRFKNTGSTMLSGNESKLNLPTLGKQV